LADVFRDDQKVSMFRDDQKVSRIRRAGLARHDATPSRRVQGRDPSEASLALQELADL
jgi:hypothetical protein